MKLKPLPLPVAIRVFPALKRTEKQSPKNKLWRLPRAMFVFDTETRTDASQRLTFGSYRFFVENVVTRRGPILMPTTCHPRTGRTLEKYVAARTDTLRLAGSRLLLLTRREFLKKFYKAVYKSRALLVGFNLPFDLSRIAFTSRPARGRFAGGFSLALWSY